MALLNSLYAGVSGLSNHQSMLDVIGNNIANVNTIGYKGSRVTFSDTFNQLIKSGTNPTNTSGGTNSFQIGLGTKVSSIDRNWSQGTFEGTSTTTDLALQGDGMFVLKSNGQQLYSRAGNFIFDADGKLVSSSNGAIVQGKVANGAGVIPAGTTLQDIVIDTNLRLPAKKTENISWSGNLDSSSGTIRTDIVELKGNLKKDSVASTYPGAAYNASDADTYEASKIYNKDGEAYQLRSYYVEAAPVAPATTSSWTYNYEIYALDSNGDPTGAAVSSGSQLLAFDTNTGACTTTSVTVNNATENINYELNFGSLSNLVADTNAIAKVDQGEELAKVQGSVTIYDSLGNAHIVSLEFEHLDSNRWSWKASIPEASGTLNSDSYGEIIFDSTGSIQTISQDGSPITSSPAIPVINFTPSSGADQQKINLNFGEGTSGITQTNLSSQIAATKQDGSASATLSDIDIDTYGNITGIFSNGNSRILAQVMVATFTNLNGLISIGDNMYNVAANSGEPLISEPGELSGTTIQSSSLEQSNVDLSEEFTKMIVAQRGFQANSRVITTSDTLLQEITNLVR